MPDLPNGQYVSQSDADRQWWPAARNVLTEVAGQYGAWITEEDLAERIQAVTGITTRQELQSWIGRVLSKVAADAAERGEPQLTSLCVTAEKRMPDDYAGVPAGTAERTREQVAAEDRLESYRYFGAEMPDFGGRPTVLAPARDRPAPAPRKRSAPRATTPPPAPALRETTCMNCFMVVPAAAKCRDCGEPLAS